MGFSTRSLAPARSRSTAAATVADAAADVPLLTADVQHFEVLARVSKLRLLK
jgi:hypothetical protein